MTRTICRKLLNPVLLLIAAIVFRQHIAKLQAVYLQLLQYAPYVLLGIVSALCFYYNRSRLFTATLSILVIYYLVQTQLQTSISDQNTMLVYSLISILQPFYLLFLLFIPERGLLNRYGVLLVMTVVIILLSAAVLTNYYSAALTLFINSWLPVKPFPGLVLSLPASACYIFVIMSAIYRLYRRNDDFALMIVSIALFGFVALAELNLENISVVMFTAVSLSLIVSMMGTSYDMAYRDELTGLLGRRALNDRLKGLARQYVIAMMDVDHFKKFNDTHGHDIGDEVLKMVARQIGAVNGGGTAYRYGGEEFCVVFVGKDIDHCRPFLDDVRLGIQDYHMTVRDSEHRPGSRQAAKQRRGRRAKNRQEISVSVTISIGMAEPDEKHIKPGEVLKAADKALYKAKKKGRNCLAD